MTGFDKKVLHLTQKGAKENVIVVEVDYLGDASWNTYKTFNLDDRDYIHHEFTDGFSAHWVWISVEKAY
jgi:hypothetical protein